MNLKVISLHHYKDFPVYWEVLEDQTTIMSSELFDLNISHEVNEENVSEVINQLIVELYSDIITIH